jgi:predicted dienelactone hydrolase
MRVLEVLIFVALLPALLGFFLPRNQRPRWLEFVARMALPLTLVHLLVERYRWQMVPAYALAVLCYLLGSRKTPKEPAKSGWLQTAGRVSAVILGLLIYAVTVFLATGLPIFKDPATTGPYSVGTTRFYFVDASREDPFAPNPHAPRELLAAAWYPADVESGAKPEPFWPEDSAAGPAISQLLHTPASFFSHVRLVKSHSYLDAPLATAETPYPVLIFSHGYGGTIWQNTPQMEELASHGFVVFSLGHTYESGAVPFPGGRVVPMSAERMASLTKAAGGPEMATLFKQMQTTNDPVEIKRISMRILALSAPMNESLTLWVGDTRYLMDEIEKINAGADSGITGPAKRFAGHLDVARMGVLGMSFGGATAGEICLSDPRCKAGLNLDGGQFGDLVDHPLSTPFLYFTSEANKMNDPIYENSRGDLYSVHVLRSTHLNFTDLSLALPGFKWISIQGMSILGRVNAGEMEHTMNAYTLAFFQRYLQGKPQPLLDGPPPASEFPDVVFTARKAPAAQPAQNSLSK